MNTTTSFNGSRGLRYPAPDVARGFMLLLIALANVGFWSYGTGRFTPSTADRIWAFINALLIHERAYPLFAMLFGFGLATMVNRRIASGASAYCQDLTGGLRAPSAAEVSQAREQATVDARRLVRRRGLWMVLFGAAHAVLFSGDIIGTYGLAAVVFAGWLTRKHRKRAMAVSVVATVATISTMHTMGSHVAAQGLSAAAVMKQGAGESATTLLSYVSGSVTSWAGNSVTTVLFSMVVPATFLGARLADTDFLAHPERHRRLLTGVGLGGLGIGVAGGIGYGIWATGGTLAGWTAPLHEVTGLAGACGWLALLALYAGGPRPDGRLTGLRKLASNVGRRSMTAYLSQTFLFAIIFLALPALTGMELHLGEAWAAGIAVAVWLATVGLCAVLERGGHSGPFETLLRTAVARSERRRRLPVPPAPVLPTETAASSDAYGLVH